METGIEKTIAVLTGAANLTKVIDLSLEDQKISAIEWAKIGIAGFQFAKGIANIKAIKEEYLDYSEEEKQTIINTFAQQFDLRNDQAELVVEQIFEAMLSLATAFKKAA